MRKKIVAGNWKMNKTFQEADDLLFEIKEMLNKQNPEGVQVIVCPPTLYLELANDISFESNFFVGAQNVNDNESGAYTGEISAPMLKSMDIEYCIIGHSERRKYFGETNQLLKDKVKKVLENEIIPIFCCGELLPERQAENHFNIVEKQLVESLFSLDDYDFSKVIIAYEPIWAIGTGVTASPQQAQEMHEHIRKLIAGKYGKEIADETTILYGGSCNAKNAKDLFSNPDVDGGLIGGASLKAADFIKIANSF